MDGLSGPADERVRWIGDALHKLTGTEPTLDRSRAGCTRLSVRVTEQPDRTQTLAVLRILRLGDRFGHTETARWERIWVEVCDQPAQPAAPQVPPAAQP
ncbi:hypothetical protein HUT16_32090 [Kitasatospora sp. NA04385]|uniref:hypothetical protein n=1 Tax=Kitasatospora sp. NA04385 TaxID=2742135 RepID=UPI00158FDD2A|nr:hypothetical protein [Kitasatospora sp. NA04385]QKW23115.1 hypothetical protein HUT16_32090 [Kitasatospora sp. NA04385]